VGRGRRGGGVDVQGGSLRVRFTFNGRRCVETFALAPTPANVRAVERVMAEIRQKIALGVFDYAATFPRSKTAAKTAPLVETVANYAGRWSKTLTGERSTVQGYRAAMNKFWLPTIGHLAITAVVHTDIASALAQKAMTATGKTTNNMLVPLRAMFEAAIADGLLDASPLAKIKNRKHQRKPIDPFTRKEMDAILAHAASHYPATVANYFLFAFTAGMRTSELIALRWGDIDWNGKTAQVSRAQVRKFEKGTKTHQVRQVDLNDLALSALIAQKPTSFMRGSDAVIFCAPDGSRWQDERLLRERFFRPCLRACGIRHRPAYNTRHSYATLALMAGVNPAYIAGQLGHANTAMLFKHYAKWIEGADSGREAARLNGVFGLQMVVKTSRTN
jgi:integrase